jgi:hypothetical protein
MLRTTNISQLFLENRQKLHHFTDTRHLSTCVVENLPKGKDISEIVIYIAKGNFRNL